MKQRGERLENRTRDILEPFDDPLPVDLSLTIVVGFHVIECMCRHTEIQGYLIISYGEGIGQLRRIRSSPPPLTWSLCRKIPPEKREAHFTLTISLIIIEEKITKTPVRVAYNFVCGRVGCWLPCEKVGA